MTPLRAPSAAGATASRTRRRVATVVALAAALSTGAAAQAASPERHRSTTDLGPNVVVLDPSMPVSEIQATVDAIHAQQVDNEMGSERYALLFEPGTYGTAAEPLQMQVGYYTEVAGLGASPSDVTINGKIEVYNRCLEDGGTSNCLALVNFWRTLGNLTLHIDAAGQDECRASANFWAVSQAVSMRRVAVTGGNLTLQDYCTAGPQYGSGGYIADSSTEFVVSGSQQQWLTRNSSVTGWSNGVWNQVFSGVEGAPDDAGFPTPPYTTLDTTPVSREKPYLLVDARGRYGVRVPSAQRDTRGVSWAGGVPRGRTIPIRDFYVARPSDSARTINSQLARGKHLLLTPGVYSIDRGLTVKRADTVVLGLGHATLTAVGGAVPLTVADVPGVVIAGVSIDAGTVSSPALLRVGTERGRHGHHRGGGHHGGHHHAKNPTTLSDVYLRVGGPHVGKAEVALEVNSDHVLIDHAWVWRADHGAEGFSGDTERWSTNTGRNGVIVNGDHVTATGLFVEHFQEYNTLWNGEDGTTVLYQNELPYDPPTQADWHHDDMLGWAGYKVADDVTTHQLHGGGVYVFNQNNPSIRTTNGFEVPETPGVRLHHIMTVNLSAGTIDHVVNGYGEAATSEEGHIGVPVYVNEYPLP